MWALHVMAELVPYEHYVPAKPDLSDLEDRVLWVLSHEDDAQAITEKAAALFRRVASMEHTRQYIVHTLLAAHAATAMPQGESALDVAQ